MELQVSYSNKEKPKTHNSIINNLNLLFGFKIMHQTDKKLNTADRHSIIN